MKTKNNDIINIMRCLDQTVLLHNNRLNLLKNKSLIFHTYNCYKFTLFIMQFEQF